MPSILVRDLPEPVHARLVDRATQRGQSLQQFLSAELTSLAMQPTMDEILARIEGRTGGQVGFDEAIADLAADRG